jgi:hypothetical protein
MRAVQCDRDPGVAQALAKGTCPICALVRTSQNDLIENLIPNQVEHLCNYHAWAIAHATPAHNAVDIFNRILESDAATLRPGFACDVCTRIRDEEELRVREMAKELRSRTNLLDWMSHHGNICLNHSVQLQTVLPVRLRNAVQKIMLRNVAEIKQELDEYRRQLESGVNTGGGVLGKVAEFLFSQRGIAR